MRKPRTELVQLRSAMDAWKREKRAHIDVLRAYKCEREALNLERLLDELDAVERKDADAPVTIAQAAEISGFHADTIRHKIAAGELENIGKKHSPRVRVGALPMKAKRAASTAYDPSADALSLLTKRGA